MQIVLDWFAKLLNLPPAFLATQPDGSRGTGGGVIQGTASEATLVTLLAARAKALQVRLGFLGFRVLGFRVCAAGCEHQGPPGTPRILGFSN